MAVALSAFLPGGPVKTVSGLLVFESDREQQVRPQWLTRLTLFWIIESCNIFRRVSIGPRNARQTGASSKFAGISTISNTNSTTTTDAPSINQGIAFLIVAMFGWGLTWPINKVILESMSPFWMAAIRSAIAALVLLAISLPGGRLVVPLRSDVPVLLSIALLHMVGFSILAAIGLHLVPVGRSVVLAYTTPLWVMPGAALFLGERLAPRRVIGVALGLLGLGVLFNPFAFDWNNRISVLGHAALLVAALCWAASILHIRGHKWRSTPFQLVPWEALLATAILLVVLCY